MKVILNAYQIPDGSVVTKKTGEKEYFLRNIIKIYGDVGLQQEIKSDGNVRFLVTANGNITVIPDITELIWHVSETDLQRYLKVRNDIHL